MSEEMKLLRALCDALGFDVVVDRDFQERKESHESAVGCHNQFGGQSDRHIQSVNRNGMIEPDKNGMVVTALRCPIIGYRVEKK